MFFTRGDSLRAVLLLLGTLTACGGGSSTSGGPSPNTPAAPATLQSISVGPGDASITAGGSEQYSATGSYSDGSTKDLTNSAAWSSSNATVATVNATGLAATLTEGTATITATFQSVAGSASLTAISLTVQVSVVASDSAGRPLSYQWQATDGVIQNVNAATTTWTLPDGPGLHFAYVLVSNGFGGYTERRVVVNTDAIGTPLKVAAPVPFAPPAPTSMGVPPQPPDSPGTIFRGFLTGGKLANVSSFPKAGSGVGPFSGIPVDVPDYHVFAENISTQQAYPSSGPVQTNVRGEFVIPNAALAPGLNIFSFDCVNPIMYLCGQWQDSPVFPVLAYSAYFNNLSLYTSEQPPFPDIAGEVLLQDGGTCGTADTFFGVEVVPTATLLDGSGNPLYLVHANQWGDYDLPYVTSAASVSIQCENNSPVIIPIQSSPVANGTTSLAVAIVPASAPTVTSMTAVLNDTQVGQMLPPATGVPSDVVPLGDAFLAEKGADNRAGACQYYKAVGAVQTCDAQGNFTGAITFEDWKSQVQIDQYAPPPSGALNGNGPVYTATYINKEDLNIARNHHSVYNGSPSDLGVLSQAPYTWVATYVCNHAGPTDASGNPVFNATQTEVDTDIQNTVNGQNLIACVAMDYSTFPVPNPSGGANLTYGPYMRFLIFGPSGQLLPSINLDTRREKFVPGTCVVCHGGDYYAGAYPADGSGLPDVGGHFLPYDEGNFEFSSQATLTQLAQENAIYNLNENILSPTVDASGTLGNDGVTAATYKLIQQGWYATSQVQNEAYVDLSWLAAGAGTLYQDVYARSCRTCHVALPNYNFEEIGTFLQSAPIVDPGNCGGSGDTGGGLDRNRMYKMPNSLVTFNRFWGSQNSPTDPFTGMPEFDQVKAFHQYFSTECKGANPIPTLAVSRSAVQPPFPAIKVGDAVEFVARTAGKR